MALNSMYCVDVPLHAASGLFMFTLPPKRGTTRKQKLIKKGELSVDELLIQNVHIHQTDESVTDITVFRLLNRAIRLHVNVFSYYRPASGGTVRM